MAAAVAVTGLAVTGSLTGIAPGTAMASFRSSSGDTIRLASHQVANRQLQSLKVESAAAAQRAELAAVRKAAARRAARRAAARRAAARRAAAQQAAAQQAAAQGAQQGSGQPAAQPSGSAQQIAAAMLSSYGWSSSQFGCLDALWSHESGWSTTATNPSSGAYGIPQALPGSKMASAGADWQTSAATQIRWGLGYIKSLYGSPCGAWGHEQATGWY